MSEQGGNANKGHIAMVGAGPGAPDLLTLRAIDRLNRADVVLFDDLASGPLLTHARPDAELVAVGKRAGRVSPKQSQVSRLMVAYARMGKRVVRLKSGDPTVFGRLDEEIEAALKAGIPYEIVPGVTSATAAAAFVGFSLTRRGIARRVQFVTGHDADSRLPVDLDLQALADPHATTCVFMGKATFAELTQKLVAHGLSPETPAILVTEVSLPTAQSRSGTITEISTYLQTRPELGASLVMYGAALKRESAGSRRPL
jgi:uroporphyrin-III C-methyltransferase